MLSGNSTARLIAIFAIGLAVIFLGEATIRRSSAQSPSQIHLYFFTNDGCAPCRLVEPSIESLKHEGYPVSTIKLNDQPQMGVRFRVDATPTVIMVENNRIVGRHAGLINGVTLKEWFAVKGIPSGAAYQARLSDRGESYQNGPTGQPRASGPTGTYALNSFSTPTMHQGTRQPRNSAERLAMQATVRLKVDDPEGTSYATGTVIHSSASESLVLTCGHVFRESQGTGVISAEYGLGTGQARSGPGKLVFYDSDARDIGLVVIQTDFRITPVPVATKSANIERGIDVFSLGCDRGALPTIRRSRIKNLARYGGEEKYDIYGRPVDGRSGGGLFSESGELIGVCNAAAVEVDEGIYTALETIHWQFAHVNLGHLFDDRLASTQPGMGPPTSLPANPIPAGTGFQEIRPGSRPSVNNVGGTAMTRQVDSDREVIIIVRSRNNPSQAETITISDPTPQLLNYLGKTAASMSPSPKRQLAVARLRTIHPPNNNSERETGANRRLSPLGSLR